MRAALGLGIVLIFGALAPSGLGGRQGPGTAPQGPDVIEIRVLSGAGAVERAGTRSGRAFIVQIVDGAGRPVAGAAVSFLMPAEGPAGVFANGMSTEVLITGKDGKATLRGIRWGREPGEVALRIAALKGRARAGTIVTLHLERRPQRLQTGPASGKAYSVSKPRKRWLLIGAIAAGAAAGGLVLGLAGGGAPAAETARAPAAVKSPGVQVGVPAITIEKP